MDWDLNLKILVKFIFLIQTTFNLQKVYKLKIHNEFPKSNIYYLIHVLKSGCHKNGMNQHSEHFLQMIPKVIIFAHSLVFKS